MDKNAKIKDLVRKVAGTDRTPSHFWRMEVVKVEGDRCTALLGEMVVPNIRLAAIPDGSKRGILITPEAGSIITVADLSGGQLRELEVVGFSAIDSMELFVGGSRIRIAKGTIEINGGKLGGLVKIHELEKNLASLKAFVEAIHAALPGAFSAIGTDTGGAPGAKTYSDSMDGKSIVIGDMEDKTVTH